MVVEEWQAKVQQHSSHKTVSNIDLMIKVLEFCSAGFTQSRNRSIDNESFMPFVEFMWSFASVFGDGSLEVLLEVGPES